MDVPSPRFSSAMGDDFEEDEKSEIIRCILHNDNKALSEILNACSLDITSIRDEMGYSLIHLSAYNNSDKCLELLIHHLVKGIDLSQESNSNHDIVAQINKRCLLKEWVNMPTTMQEVTNS
jgi:ankyrin repeat protein